MARLQAEEADPKAPQLDPTDPFKQLKNKRITAGELWKVLSDIPPESWGRYKAYLYRLWPKIDRALSNPANPTNIAVIEAPFDEKWLLREHGSGKYEVKLTDQSRPESFRCLCKANVDTHDQEYPPVLDFRELDMGHDGNRSYIQGLQARGLLPKNGNTPAGGDAQVMNRLLDMLAAKQKEVPPQSPESQAIAKAMEILTTAYKTGIENTQVKEGGAVKEALTVVKDILSMQEKRPADGAGTVKETLEMVKEILKTNKPPEVASPIEVVSKTMEGLKSLVVLMKPEKEEVRADTVERKITSQFIEKAMDKLLGAGAGDDSAGAGGRYGKYEFWADLVKQAPVIMGGIQGMFIHGITAWKTSPEEWKDAMRPQVPAGAGAQPSPPQVPGPTGQSPGPTQIPVNLQKLMEVGGIVAGAFTRGESGGAVADSVASLFGQDTYAQIRAIGPEQIVGLFKQSPLWPQVSLQEPQFVQFVEEFCNPPQEPDPDDDEPPVPEAPARKGARK